MGKRHHYIPKFLLKHFASQSLDNGTYLIWQVRLGCAPKEVSTKDIGVEVKFYGDQILETNLEGKETQFAPVLDHILNGCDPKSVSKLLGELVWTQMIRTRSFRTSFTKAVQSLVTQLFSEVNAQNLVKSIRMRAYEQIDLLIEEGKTQLKLAEKIIIEECLKIPALRNSLVEATITHMCETELLNFFSKMILLQVQGKQFEIEVKEAHNIALSSMLDNEKTPEKLFSLFWKIQIFDDNSVILGDNCVLFIDDQNQFVPFAEKTSDWIAVVMPISHNKIVIGQISDIEIELNVDSLNLASSSFSSSTFYCSKISEKMETYASRIGSKNPFVSLDFINEIINSTWKPN